MQLLPLLLSIAVASANKFLEPDGKREVDTTFVEPENITFHDYENPEGRIVNGMRAARGQFPYQAGLIIKDNQNNNYKCGGSVISNLWILTAAHCTYR